LGADNHDITSMRMLLRHIYSTLLIDVLFDLLIYGVFLFLFTCSIFLFSLHLPAGALLH